MPTATHPSTDRTQCCFTAVIETPQTPLAEMYCENLLPDLDLLKSTIKRSLVEKFVEGNERPCDNNDFLESRKRREKLSSDIKILIENFGNSSTSCLRGDKETRHHAPDIENELLALILILCGQNLILQPWNSDTIVKNCDTILAEVLKLYNCNNVSELISRYCKINLTKDILQIVCADLTVSEWKCYPASVACFKWILEMIKQPELSQYLQFVLPPALLLTDDFVSENRITGAHCLSHVVQNTTIAELQFCGYGDVIYDALIPILRIREANLICSAIPPLVTLATKLEFNLGKKNLSKWSKFDDVLEIFLENMELEQMIDLRNCYISNLSLLISALGYGMVRWSKRLLRIFDEYIQIAGKYSDEKSTNSCLKAIDIFIEFSTKVTPLHAEHLLYTLLIALNSSGYSSSEVQKENKEITLKCINAVLKSLSAIEQENVKKDLQENLPSIENFNNFYEQILSLF